MRKLAGKAQGAVNLQVCHAGHLLDAVANRDRLHPGGCVHYRDHPGIQVHGVAALDELAIGADQIHPREARAPAVDGVAVAVGGGGNGGGVPHHHEAAHAVDRHPAIGWQAHGVDAQNVGIQRQVKISHAVVAQA